MWTSEAAEPDNGFKTHTPMVLHEPRGGAPNPRGTSTRGRHEQARERTDHHPKPAVEGRPTALPFCHRGFRPDFGLHLRRVLCSAHFLDVRRPAGHLNGAGPRGIEDLLGPERRMPGGHRRALDPHLPRQRQRAVQHRRLQPAKRHRNGQHVPHRHGGPR